MQTIGQRLRHARMANAMEQTELSRRSGVPVVTISRIENDYNKASPRMATVRALCTALDIDPGWLLFGETDDVKKAAA